MIIRNETAADVAAISEVTIAVFQTLTVRQHTEQFVIQALKDARRRHTDVIKLTCQTVTLDR